MNGTMIRLLSLLALLVAGCLPPPKPTQPEDVDPKYPVGPFSLTERSGKPVTDKDLRGHVWIASFIFTRCNGPCPAVTSTVARLQDELKGERGVKFVTFTVDPKRDDLSALKAYADSRRADPEKWLFLTGDEETVHTVLREQFMQSVGRNEGSGVKEGDEFSHSTRLTVVDRDGLIRGFYPGLPDERDADPKGSFEAGLKRLRARVAELVK